MYCKDHNTKDNCPECQNKCKEYLEYKEVENERCNKMD